MEQEALHVESAVSDRPNTDLPGTLRLAVERPLGVAEEEGLAEKLVEFLGCRFAVDFDYCTPEIPRGPGGKFEDFVREIKVDN